MNDPSSGVPPQLLRHVALVCNHTYPVLPSFNIDAVARHLQEAPRIVRDISTMTWMALLEPPRDGTLILVWQPPQSTQFVSDGYIWTDMEKGYTQQLPGYTFEMHIHQCGYRQGFENITAHARRRYRLIPSRDAVSNLPPVDPSLWLIHYHQAEPQHRVPINSVPVPDLLRRIYAERHALQSYGQLQLQHKEFMLRDRDNWPTINTPGHSAPAYPQTTMGYPNNVLAHMNRSQHPTHAQNVQTGSSGISGPSPAKRPRHSSTSHGQVSATAIPVPSMPPNLAFEDEEATSGVDYMDVLTPQEISSHRYRQHHEWLEEIISSPYDTRQIVPGELGIGRKGELESLTKDFFNAHTKEKVGTDLDLPGSPKKDHYLEGKAVVEDVPAPRVGRLESGQAQHFQKLAAQRMADIRAEMDQLKKQHDRRMAKINKVQSWKDNEQKLRNMTLEMMSGHSAQDGLSQERQIKELTNGVEDTLGRQIKSLPLVQCIDKGGLEDQSSATSEKNLDLKLADPMSQMNIPRDSTSAEQNAEGMTFSPDSPGLILAPQASATGATNSRPSSVAQAQNVHEHDAPPEDWVLVNEAGDEAPQDARDERSEFDSFTNNAAMHMDAKTGIDSGEAENAVNSESELTFENNDFTDTLDFGLDTAGDELSGYTHELERQDLGMTDELTNHTGAPNEETS